MTWVHSCGFPAPNGSLVCPGCGFVFAPARVIGPAFPQVRRGKPAAGSRASFLRARRERLGVCLECGRPLLDPVSVARKIGPVCWQKLQEVHGSGSRLDAGRT